MRNDVGYSYLLPAEDVQRVKTQYLFRHTHTPQKKRGKEEEERLNF